LKTRICDGWEEDYQEMSNAVESLNAERRMLVQYNRGSDAQLARVMDDAMNMLKTASEDYKKRQWELEGLQLRQEKDESVFPARSEWGSLLRSCISGAEDAEPEPKKVSGQKRDPSRREELRRMMSPLLNGEEPASDTTF